MKPINGNILGKEVKEEKTQSGIYIPTSANKNYIKAEVIAFDQKITGLKVGDIVLVHQNAPLQPTEEDQIFFNYGYVLSIE